MRREQGNARSRRGRGKRPGFHEVTEQLTRLLSPEHVDALREQSGYNPRQRKATAWRLLLCSMEACLHGQTLGFASLRAYFVKRFGPIQPRAFQLRFKSAQAVDFFKRALDGLITEVLAPYAPELGGRFKAFTDVVLYDGTQQRVPYRGRTQGLKSPCKHTASSKWSIGYSLRHGAMMHAHADAGVSSDLKLVQAHAPLWQTGVLYVLDLGYFCKKFYQDALTHGAHLLMRLKLNDSVRNHLWVTALHTSDGGGKLHGPYHVGRYLKRARRLGRDHIDVQVDWGHRRGELSLRVCGIYHRHRWLLYLTTVPPHTMPCMDVVQTYRLRWLIEFLFREIKQQMDWGRCLTADKHALMALSYAALFTHTLVRSLRLDAALKHKLPLESLRPLAALHAIRPFATDLIHALVKRSIHTLNMLFKHLRHVIFTLAYQPKTSRSRPRVAASLGSVGV